jgi:GT2 family glycosyltransferase
VPDDSPTPLASLLVPTSTQAGRLKDCLAALAERLPATVPAEILVVASAATPEVMEVLATAADRRLRVIECAVNLGVAGGYNRARAAARGELLCLLHDDTVILDGWLEAMLAAAARHPESGAFGGVVLNPDLSLQSAGWLLWADAVASPAWPPGTDPADIDEESSLDLGATCAMAIRAELFDAVGGLEEGFHPGYYVDADFSLACREAGRGLRLVPSARVVHHRGSSSSSAYRDFLSERNRRRFFAKWADRIADRPRFDPSPAGRADGRARACAEAAALVATGAAQRPLVPRFHLDPSEQEARLERAERDTLREYSSALEASLASTREGLHWLEEKTLELGRIAGVEVELDATGWPRFDLLIAALAGRLGASGEAKL